MVQTHIAIDPEIKKWLDKLKQKHACKSTNEVFIVLRDCYNERYHSPKDIIRSEIFRLHTMHETELDQTDREILSGVTALLKATNPKSQGTILTSLKKKLWDLGRKNTKKQSVNKKQHGKNKGGI
jgi:hypothetical protein